MPPTATDGYRIGYHVNSSDPANADRPLDVQATPEQVRHLAEEGYLVRERLIQGDLLERLRSAVDEVAASAGGEGAAGGGGFSGLFIRNLLDLHPAFLEMLRFAPMLSVARAVLGPQVQIHGAVTRVSYPNATNQGVEWHFHQRIVPPPLPAFFARTAIVDNLIYLDDVTEASGPLCVVPRTHLLDEELPTGDFGDKSGQIVLPVPAGSCVTSHSSLWHKAMPTRPGGGVRRLLIFGYSPTWMKQVDKPGGGLTDALLPGADRETRELLGLTGWM